MRALVLLLLLFGKPGVNAVINVPCGGNVTVTVSLPQAKVGQPYMVTFNPITGNPPFKFVWVDGSLPAGLEFYDSGQIAGTPNSKVDTSFTLQCWGS